jgi:hypothetical protein
MEEKGLHFICLNTFICPTWMALPVVYTPTSIALRLTEERKPPHQDKTIVFQELT